MTGAGRPILGVHYYQTRMRVLFIVLISFVVLFGTYVLLGTEAPTPTTTTTTTTIKPQQERERRERRERERAREREREREISLTKSGASMLAHEIKSIVHLPEKSMIVINLKTQRECLEPHLIGRMSGPMLAKLVWEEKGTSRRTVMLLSGATTCLLCFQGNISLKFLQPCATNLLFIHPILLAFVW